jgi:hypothetical protein
MKQMLLTLITIMLLIGCSSEEMSKDELAALQIYINVHNSKALTDLNIAWIKEEGNLEIEHFNIRKTSEFARYKESSEAVFRSNWNKPYQIHKDTALTIKSYLEYCKANGKDPKAFYKFMH